MALQSYTGGFTATNGWLLQDEGLRDLLVDAPHGVEDWLESIGSQPAAVLLTHLHFDHVLGLPGLLERHPDLRVLAHSPREPELTLESLLGGQVVLPPFEVGETLAGRDELELEGRRFELFYLPGHSIDSLAFHQAEEKRVFTGDTLMAGTTGRTDFPRGSQAQLFTAIRRHLLPLDEATEVHPGHGPSSTIGVERRTNPFVGEAG